MVNTYDIAYGMGLILAAPIWLVLPKARRKVLSALRQRMGQDEANLTRPDDQPAVWIHAVSLGELNATPKLVSLLAEARPELHFVISSTSDTGYARARHLYGGNDRATVIRFPLDFSFTIRQTLDRQRPVAIVLLELEVWPNMMRECERRGIPVMVVNGRMTASSYSRYRLAGPVVRRMFARLAAACAQEPAYAERFIALGTPRERVRVTGTMKFDNAQIADSIEGADTLAAALGLRPGSEHILVCGSTGPGEEQIVLDHYRALLREHPTLRLIIVPRHPERFDEVARLIEFAEFPLVRRSNSKPEGPNSKSDISNLKSQSPVILGDTMGELRKFYSLADVVVVGRTLVDLGTRQHGSDMIEPAALAKPVIVGPFTGNFTEVMNAFRSANAMAEVAAPHGLGDAIGKILGDRETAAAMGNRAQGVVRSQQGATARHVEVILAHLPGPS